jgi:hypothetical protein
MWEPVYWSGFNKVLPWANHGFQLSSDYWRNSVQSDHIRCASLLITDSRLDFHFHTVFLSDTPPSIYNANPRLMTPPGGVTRHLLKIWPNSEKTGSQNCQSWLTSFWLATDQCQIWVPKVGLRSLTFTDKFRLQKIAKKSVPAKKMLAWEGDFWLELNWLLTHQNSWVKKTKKKKCWP